VTVAQSVSFAYGLRATEFVLYIYKYIYIYAYIKMTKKTQGLYMRVDSETHPTEYSAGPAVQRKAAHRTQRVPCPAAADRTAQLESWNTNIPYRQPHDAVAVSGSTDWAIRRTSHSHLLSGVNARSLSSILATLLGVSAISAVFRKFRVAVPTIQSQESDSCSFKRSPSLRNVLCCV
jgi:hypothetical protein